MTTTPSSPRARAPLLVSPTLRACPSPPMTMRPMSPRSMSAFSQDSMPAGVARSERFDSNDFLFPRRSRLSSGSSADQTTILELTPPRPPLEASPATLWRLAGFITMHCAAFSIQIACAINFATSMNRMSAIGMSTPIVVSGLFCTYAAWMAEAPLTAPRLLPLRRLPWLLGIPLSIPFGLFQGIVIVLALEDYYLRRSSLQSQGLQQLQSAAYTKNTLHCKAVNGLFEGFVSLTIVLYCYWTLGYPEEEPITYSTWESEPLFLLASGAVLLVSSGLGLLELDYCVSRTMSRQMRRSMCKSVLHITLRACEVATRVCLYVWFTVDLRLMRWWWWVPPAVDFVSVFVLISIFGGAESTAAVRFLCSVPTMFANIFMFVDSPYKRRAARRLSRALGIHRLCSFVLLPVIAVFFGKTCTCRDEWQGHGTIFFGAIALIPVHWACLCLVTRGRPDSAMPDIYTECEKGCVVGVRSAIRSLTHSAAVGLNLNCRDTDGYTPLMLAAKEGHARVCTLLMQEGARPELPVFNENLSIRCCLNREARRHWTAVHMAAYKGFDEVVLEILDKEADESEDSFQDTKGNTPLHIAVEAGQLEVVKVLLAKRPPWQEVVNWRGQRPIDLAHSEELKTAFVQQAMSSREGGNNPLGPGPRREENPSTWEKVELYIKRSTQEDEQQVAPGLCSFIIASCGGTLARIFLANAPSPIARNLSRISEASEDGYHFSLTVDGDNNPRTGPRVNSRDGSIPMQSLHYDPWRGMGEDPGPTMDDLEPVDKFGEPIPRWRASVEQGRSLSSGRGLSQIPYEAVLGEGSYGIVWRAKDSSTDTWYAVKTIKNGNNDNSAARRECDVADRIRLVPHPCLVRLFHVHNFLDSGLYTLIMEFCEGGDLLSQIRKTKEEARQQQRVYQPPRPAHKWIGQVFLGLEHMHKRMETLLRDLKPENVVLNGQGCAKLTDFGFGRFGLESNGIWSFGIPVGSPGYVAPEVLRQADYDYHADLYSLGVLVWVLLTGGLRSRLDPTPPMGVRRHKMDYEAHFSDAQLLAQCISEPERHHARKMKEGPRDFVERLTNEDPQKRLDHEDIREHRFFRVLALPPFEAPPSAVEAWLRRATSGPPPAPPSAAAAGGALPTPTPGPGTPAAAAAPPASARPTAAAAAAAAAAAVAAPGTPARPQPQTQRQASPTAGTLGPATAMAMAVVAADQRKTVSPPPPISTVPAPGLSTGEAK